MKLIFKDQKIYNFFHTALINIILLLAFVSSSFAMDCVQSAYSVTNTVASYNSTTNQTTFTWNVCWDGTPPSLSHFDIGVSTCITQSQVVSSSPVTVNIGQDGSHPSNVYVIKWDNPNLPSANSCTDFTIILNGNFLPATNTTSYIKAGTGFCSYSTIGPDCASSPSPSASVTASASASASTSPSNSPSASISSSISPSISPTVSPSISPTISASATPTVSSSISPSISPSISATSSPSISASISLTPSASFSPSASSSFSPSSSASPESSPSASTSESPSPSATASASETPSVSASASETASVSPSASASESASPTPTSSASETPSVSASPSETASVSPSASVSESASPTPTSTASETPSITPSPSASTSPSASPSQPPSFTTSCSAGGPYNVACGSSSVVLGASSSILSDPFSHLIWSTDCSGANFSNPESTNPVLSFTDIDNNSESCSVSLFVESDSGGASCDSTISFSVCPTCEDISIKEAQFAVDGTSRSQANTVKKLAKQLVRASKGNKSIKNFANNAYKQANALHAVAWTKTWSVQSILTSCTGPSNCVSASNEEYVQALKDNSLSLLNLAQEVVKKGISTTGRKNFGKSLLKIAQELHATNLAVVQTVPASISVCS